MKHRHFPTTPSGPLVQNIDQMEFIASFLQFIKLISCIHQRKHVYLEKTLLIFKAFFPPQNKFCLAWIYFINAKCSFKGILKGKDNYYKD